VEGGDGAAEVGDDDRSADDQADGEGFEEFVVGDAFLDAAEDVVRDAVVAAEDEGGDEAEQLLCPRGQGAVLVDAGVEGEEALDVEVAGLEDALVHALAERAELFQIHVAAAFSSATARSSGGPSFRRKRVNPLPFSSRTVSIMRPESA